MPAAPHPGRDSPEGPDRSPGIPFLPAVAFIAATLCAFVLGHGGETTSPGSAAAAEPVHMAPAKPAIPPCPADAGWDDPTPPRHVHGDTWYVGTCGIAAVLIRGDDGHVLIDAGTQRGGALVLDNLKTLGIAPRDVHWLLVSHEHLDHAGGLAALQAATGAPLLARAPAIATLRSGRSDRSDPQFLTLKPFPPVADVQEVADGRTLRLGRLALTAHATPGHTAGGTSWTWRSCEGDGECLDIAYVDSLTAVSDAEYRFSDASAHPGVLEAFHTTLERVEALPCDILITPHPNASGFWERMGTDAARPLRDPTACRAYAAAARERLERRLARERDQPPQQIPENTP